MDVETNATETNDIDYKAELDSLKAEMEAIKTKAENEHRGMVGRFRAQEEEKAALQKALEEAKATTAGGKKTGNDDAVALKTQISELQEAMRKQAKKEELVKRGAKRQAIVKSMTDAGADPALIGVAVDSILLNNSDNIRAIENPATGSYEVKHVDPLTEIASPIGEYVAAYMQSDVGKRLIPAKANPTIPGGFGRPHSGEQITLTSKEFNKLTTEQMKSGKYAVEGV